MLAREYELREKIYESTTSILYRAIALKDRQPVILKMCPEEYPGPEKVAQLRYEYELTKLVAGTNVIEAREFMAENGGIVAYEDFGGYALNECEYAAWPLREKISIVLKIVEGLATVHASDVIHKDLNPANIVLNRASGQLKLIDFGNATRLTKEQLNVSRVRIEGTLAYMAPEQTGRMNRAVDYRADYYALGATMYELLGNQFLFPQAQDSVELLHCLLAKEPRPLSDVQPEIPPVLSRMVMKLLAKNAEDRYQSLFGLKADLENCLEQLDSKGQIDEFMIGLKDDVGEFRIPQRLYGRKQELAELISGYEKIYRGGFELMLVSGPSGVGKSLLVSELQKAVVQGRGHFIAGKYERHKRGTPYSALLEAFRDLVRSVLTEPDENIAALRTRLKEKLGFNGRLISDVVPEVKYLIGEQPAIEELTPVENQNRFHFVFREFINAFVAYRQTLVIFLDDLQWVDDASLELLNTLVLAQEHSYLYLIGAYREDEVDALHPLTIALNELEKRGGGSVRKIALKSLTTDAIEELLMDTLKCETRRSRELAEVIQHKTDGVPFFINELLLQLEKQHLIWFDYQEGCWKWDLQGIQNAGIADSMVELLAKRIRCQDEDTRRVLCMAALVGNRFEFTLLAELDPERQHQTAAALWTALQEGFIQPLDPAYKYIQDTKVNSLFRFFHDSIQQAAQMLLSEQERSEMHLRIGRLLREQEKSIGGESRIFDMVAHLNSAQPLIDDPAELRELGALNYWAGKKAKRSSAFVASLEHFRHALELLGADAWQKNPALALDVYVQAAAVAYSCGDYATMLRYADSVFDHCRDNVVRVPIYEIRIRALLAQGDAAAAVQLALEALEELDVRFPKRIVKPYLLAQLAASRFFLFVRGLEPLDRLPVLKDAKKEAVMRLLAAVSSSAYLAEPELFILMVLKQVEITVKHGTSSRSPFAYCLYGVIVGGLLGDAENGYTLAKLGLSALGESSYQETAGKTMVVGNLFAAHWKDPLETVIAEFMRAYRISMTVGDLEYAAWGLMAHGFHSFFAGAALGGVENNLATAADKIKTELCQETQYRYTCSFLRLVQQLRGESSNDDGRELQELFAAKRDNNGLYYCHSNQMFEHLVFGRYEQALDAMRRAKPYLDSVLSTIHQPMFCYASTLLYLIEEAKNSEEERREVNRQIERMKNWAKLSPHTYGGKYRLVQAEQYRNERRNAEAAIAYDEAIEAALENGFIQDAALANERAGDFYQKQGKETIARSYRLEAYHLYRRWGAEGKAKRLRDQYLYLWLKPEEAAELATRCSLRLTAPQVFDWASIVKIAQILSSEMNYERLVVKMMHIVMENAGAQRALFLAQEGLELKVEALGEMNGADVNVQVLGDAAMQQPDFSLGIINYVLRTEDSVVIEQAATDRLFANDPYIIARQPVSLLCLPVLTQKKVIGVLYFENNLMKGAFTPERIEILQVIASQAAISLENIILYRQMEEKVQERTKLLNERTRELERAYEEVKYVSMHDPLTGLYNRAYFEQEMQRLGKRRQGVTGVLVCDMDGLKRINDSQGHEAGDRMLQAAANVLKGTFRPCDMVARIGGDEFAVLVPDADIGLLKQLKARIQTATMLHNEDHGSKDLSISVGVAVTSCEKASMIDAFKQADAQMYLDKEAKPALQRRLDG